jgi:four helix bundle protein
MEYNLEKRTGDFSKSLLLLCKNIKLSTYNRSIIDQVIRSGTSVGANYREANGAPSRKDFRNKIHICKKEAKETTYWLDLLCEVEPERSTEIEIIKKESHELTLIFSKIASSSS